MFKIIKERFSKRKRLAKNHPEILRYEELEQRVLFSADVVPGLDTAAVEEQVIAQDVGSDAPVEREAEPETVEQKAEEARSELVLVNENVADHEQLIADLQGSDNNRVIEVVVLESDRDGIEQVTKILSERSDLAAVHFITHGADGQINLGDGWLDSTSLQQNIDAVAGWGNALTETGDILFYGCDFASKDGQPLIESLSILTGADVAASTDDTGHALLGGDWDLEYRTGSIETGVAMSSNAQNDWVDLLNVTVNSTSSAATVDAATSLTWSHEVASGDNLLLTVSISFDGSGQSTEVTYHETPLTLVGRHTSVKHTVEIWELTAPSQGTADIVATFSGSLRANGGAVVFNGVNQTTPTGSLQSAAGTSSQAASITVSSAPGEIVLDTVITDVSSTLVVGADQTEQWIEPNAGMDRVSASSIEAGAASVTMSWGGPADDWTIVAVAVKPISNIAPTLTTFTTVIDTTNEDTQVEVTLAELATQGNETDVDGTVDAFVVKAVTTGTLKIGTDAGSATAWAATTNDTIDGSNHAYWTPASNANGTQNAFAVVAKDNLGAESVGNVTVQVDVTAVNDDPTNAGSLPTDLVFLEDTQGKLNLSAIDLSDVDAGLGDLTLTITSANGHLQTLGWPGLTLGGSQSQLILTGKLNDLNDFLNDVNSIDYEHATPNMSGDNVDLITIEITDNDNTGLGGGGTITLGTINIDIDPVAPQVDLDENDSAETGNNFTTTWTQGGGQIQIADTDAVITDADSATLQSLTVTLTNHLDGADERMVADTSGTSISVTYALGVGEYYVYLTGNDTVANYEQVLKSIVYDNTSATPDPTTRVVTVQASDGTNVSTVATTSINMTITNVAPVITSNGGGATANINVVENTTAVTTVTATDGDGDSLTYSISGGADAAKFSINSTTGELNFIAAPDFESPTDADVDNVYEVTVQVSDGTVTDTQAISVTVTDVGSTLTVTTTADILDADTSSIEALVASKGADGQISLREAIIAANNNGSPVTINLGNGTYTLALAGAGDDTGSTGDLDIHGNVTIVGSGAATTIIDANSIDRVLEVHNETINVQISGVTITNGSVSGDRGAGLQIWNKATVGLTDVVVSGNSTTGAVSSAQGGGIRNLGTLTMDNVRLTGNHADGQGGGLFNQGTVTITSSLFDANTAGDMGAGIRNTGANADLTLTNVTISGNTSVDHGAGLSNSADATLYNVTVTQNSSTGGAASGGGIDEAMASASTIITNSIIQDNSAAGGSPDASGTFESQGYNLIGDTSGNTGWLASDLVNTSTTLGALSDNGGFTMTHALLGGSRGIDEGTNTGAPTTDQRGETRDASIDIGAFEYIAGLNSAPDITSNGGGVTAAVNVVENTTAVTTVTANDADGDTPTFSITGGADAALFGIDANSGVLTFNSAPNFEAPADADSNNVYEVTVQVSDGKGGTDTQAISVTVTDALELVVTNTNATGTGSLHDAILNANENVGVTDTITFNIPGGGPHVISLTGALPAITDAVIINGTTDPDYAGDPIIRLDGSSAGAGVNGLTFTSTSDGSEIRGLMITGFTQHGIQVDSGADGITITNNWIGTTGTGSVGDGNGNTGINVQGANTVIGGTGANDGNVITNNGNEGINVTGSGATGMIIQGNIIGLDPDGASGSGNADVGIALLSGANNTVIGGSTAAVRNIISNNYEGIEINSNNNTVQGNYIGTDITGSLDRGNRSDDGIELQNGATGNLIGGTGTGEGNLISGNAQNGILIKNADNNTVQGNLIGTDVNGTADIGNNDDGIRIESSTGNAIGGTSAAARNVISGNNGSGIYDYSSTTTILGNYIGVDINGTATLGNTVHGVSVWYASGTIIGGSGANDGNVIGGNSGQGILLYGGSGVTIQGNYIGTDNSGTIDLGNSQNGIVTSSNPMNSLIGGTGAGEGNMIAFNTLDGVKISSGSGHSVLGNAIYSNDEMGIDLVGGTEDGFGVTGNDADDSDLGANVLQNYPVLSSASTDGGTTLTVAGALTSTVNTNFRIEFFTSTVADASGFGEAERYLGHVDVTTDVTGGAVFSVPLSVSVAVGDFVTATATFISDPSQVGVDDQLAYGSTSEFSAAIVAATNAAPVITTNGGGATANINVAENTTAVTTVTATDADGDQIEYTITGGADAALFDIDRNTGVLSFLSAPDFESPGDANSDNDYEVVVTADDQISTPDTQNINVTVTNINEGPDQNVQINENTILAASMGAGDQDAPPYGIVGGADAALFQVSHNPVSRTFYLMFSVPPDFESPSDSNLDNVYEVTVNFNDVIYNYFVTVKDANDGPAGLPVITGTATEDQTLTADASGIGDEDGLGSFSYQWLRDGSAISGATGTTYTLGDADVGAQISVQVSYTDGFGANETVTSAQTSVVANINDAPVLDNSGFLTLTTITEDDTNNNGNLISEIIASDGGDRITDPDAGALEGIAIYNLTNGNGTWEFNVGSGWNPVGTVSVNSSLLLRATDRLRFVPDGQNADNAFVTFAAWDQTTGVAGTKVDTSSYGGTTAFSELVETAAITVTAVNDAPIVDLNGSDDGGTDFTATFTEGGGAVNVTDADALITDVDDTTYQNLIINLSGFSDVADERIVLAGYTFTYDTSAVVVRTVGSTDFEIDFDGSGFHVMRDGGGMMPVADLQTLMRGITYENISQGPTSGDRVIEFTAQDAPGLLGPTATSTITVNALNDAPVVTTTGGSTAYTEQTAATVIDAGITLVDPDGFDGVNPSDQYTAVIQITGNYEAADTLGFTSTSNIQGVLAGDMLTLSIIGGQTATVMDFQAALRTVTFYNGSDTPSELDRTITFSFDDGVDSSNLSTKTVQVTAVNDDPTNDGSLPTDVTVLEGVSTGIDLSVVDFGDLDHNNQLLTVTLTTSTGGRLFASTDMDVIVSGSGGSTLTLTGGISNLNSFFNSATHIQYLHTNTNLAGNNVDTIQVQIRDNGNTGTGGGTNIDLGTVNVDITNVNDAPAGADKTVSTNEDTDYVFSETDFGFSDTNDSPTDSLANIIITTAPSNGTLYLDANDDGIVDGGETLVATNTVAVADITAGKLKFKPAADANGTGYDSFTFQVQDDGGTANSGIDTDPIANTITINVTAVNDAPVLGAIGNQTVDELATLTFTATATDLDLPTDTLTYSLDAASIALGMTIDAYTGVFSWTPTESQGGTSPSVTITVTDDGTGNLVDNETFTITVNDINTAPVLGAIGNQTVDELATLTFTATATDADLPADTLTFSLDAASIALGMSIDANTGVFSWTPTEGQSGLTPSVTVTVTDNGTGNLVDSETFTITVNDTNTAPLLGAIGNQTVDELATLTFTATATDSDLPADTLTFSLDAASIALGMTIDANTGVFSWTPTEGQGGSAPSVTITVTDNGTGNLIDSETFTITVNDVNVAPVLGAIGNQSINELATLSFTATATDSDLPADTLTFSLDAASIALGMSIDANTGVFFWTPTEGQGGSAPSVTITVTDNGTGNLVDSETFTITVNDVNVAPVLGAIGNQSVNELATLSFTATATDSDLPVDTLTFSLDAASLTAGMTIDANTGVFSWTPTEAQGGTSPSVTITVTDSGTGNLVDSETFTITVNDTNTAPVLGAIGNQTVDELATLTFTATATDADLPVDTLTYSLDAASIALGMSIDANTGIFSWTPTEGQGGISPSVTITVTDSGTGNLIDSETFTITVNDTNTAPVLGAIGNQTVDELTTLTFTATATDSDLPADTLTFSLDAASIALGMSIDANTGVFSWTPTEGQGGLTPSVTVTVTDNGTGNLVDSETFTITVNDINVAPVLGAIGNQTVDELATLTFTATATDADLPADTLTFSLDASSISLGMSIDANTGVFSWTPSEGQGGLTPSVTITVTDDGAGNLIDSETFTITVNDINVAPVLGAIGNQTVDELATLTFTATATDADLPADTLTFSLDASSISLGMSIDANTGVFSWTPTEGQGGLTPSVTVTVTDNGTGNLIDSETFTITVNDINTAPVLGAIGNQTVDELATLTFTATATDADLPADTLTFSLDAASVALGMSIDANTGVFSWTPTEAQGGLTPSVTVTVTDSGTGNLVDSETFTITVNDVNVAPVLGAIGNQTVNELATLTFTATATDADLPADTLTFSIDAASIALGMSIDANTGVFTWTPTEGQGGMTLSVTVTVTDNGTGNLVDSETFSITVNDINTAPVLNAIGNQTVDELATLTFTATATDADLPADTLTFSLDAASIAAGMTIDANTGEFSWTPTEAHGGTTPSVTITVTDSGTGNLIDSEIFTITVNDINVAPVLGAIGNQTVDELATLTFTATATDADLPADTLTYSLDAASIALGMSIDANTGVFSWTPTEGQGGLTPSVTVTVTDDGTGNLVDSETFTITVNDTNTAPVLGAIGNQTVNELATLTFTATATDADLPADTLTFSLDAASIALGMTIDANTGVFSWSPTESQGGIAPSVTITVTDSGTGNLVDSETFTITVNDINTAPVLGAIGNQTVDELATLTFTATATDSDLPADTLTFSLDAASIALGMTIDANTGVFSWTPTESQGGTSPSVTITVTDDGTGNLVDSETFAITVNDINTAPVLGAIGNQTVDELSTLKFTATATDSDIPADTLTFSLDAASIALGMSIDANTGVFSWTPTEGQGGLTPSVTVTVTDSGTGNLTDSETFTITVNDTNTAPILGAVGNQTVDELATLSFTATATDSDLPADNLTYSLDAASIALGMTIDANTGVFSWTPTEGQGGLTPSVTVTVTDSGTGNLVDSETFTITVNDINTAPVLGAIGNQTVDELSTLTFTATATDSDIPADTLTYRLDAASIALGMTIDANTGIFSWTPTEGQGGLTPSVTVTVTDSGNGNLTDSETFTITVNDANTAPILGAIGNQTIDEMATLTFTATATDSDLPADTLNYSLDAASIALGMTIDANTGVFSWTPTEGQGGLTPSVNVTVTDSGAGNLLDSETFSITVNEINVAPVINNATFAIDENSTNGTAVGTVPVTDPDTGDTHVYSITAGNTGGAFAIDNAGNITVANSTALDFEITPVFTLTVQVQDKGGTGLVDAATITVNLNNLNEAPISLGIANVTVGEDAPNTVIDLFAAFADYEDADANLTYTITTNTNPALFSSTLIDGVAGTLTLDYAPNAYGTATVTVRATDTGGLFVESTFTVTVNPVNDAPATTPVTLAAITEDGGGRLITQAELLANANDVDGPTLTATNLAISAGSGILVDNGDATWNYTPAANDDTSVSFTYTVTDGSLTAAGSATLDITPVNDTPVTNNDSATVDEGQNVVINLVGNDADVENALDLSSISITATPTNGALVDNGDGTLTYTHDGSKTTSDSFSYTINDVSGATSNIAAVSLTVNPANDNDPSDSTDPDPILLVDPVTDEDDDTDVENPTYEAPGEDPLTENEVVSPVEAVQTPEVSGDTDESIVEIKDSQDEESQDIIYLTDEIDRNTQSEEREDDRGYTYYDNDLFEGMSSLKYWNLIDNAAQSGPVAVNLDDISFLDFDSEDNDPVILDEDYDALRQEIDESFDTELKGQSIKAKIVTATAATFTVGIVSYLLRAGSLVASMMSALPLWRGFDPIAIFSGNKKKKKKQNEISDAGKLKPEAFFDGDAE